MATRSIPTLSNRPTCRATSSLVPTPSVAATRTGRRYPAGTSNSPPNPPTPDSTPGRVVAAASGAMSSTARDPASIDTPDAAYVSPSRDTRALQHALVERCRDGDGVVAGEARRAEPGARRIDALHQPVERQVGEAVHAEK